MISELSVSELQKENAELKKLISKVENAYSLLDEIMQDYRRITGDEGEKSTVSDNDDVKKILKKYSRI